MPYHGPPVLTLSGAFFRWTLDPWVLAVVLVLGGGYLYAMRRVRRVTEWGVARPIWFLGLGLGPLVLATMSWIGVYQGALFYARATQTVLLVLVTPLFLALGRPITLITTAFSARWLERAIGSRVAKVLTFPAITTFALVLVPFVMYFSPWYTASFHSTAIRELTYLALIVPGFAFFWTLLRVDPVPKAYSYAVSMWITGAEVIGDAVLGLAIIADNGLIGAAWYHAVARPWGPTLRTDQVIGGGVLWVLGDVVGLPFLAAQLIAMMREDESAAAKIDAELDARAAARAARTAQTPAAQTPAAQTPAAQTPAAQTPSTTPAPVATTVPETDERPWWETDSRFTGRFKPPR